MKKKVKIMITSDKEYLSGGVYYQYILLDELKIEAVDNDEFMAFKNRLKSHLHPQDHLDNLVGGELSLDFEFAKDLRLMDIVGPKCFSVKSEDGRRLIHLMDNTYMRFVLKMKEWKTPNGLHLDFIATSGGGEYNLMYDCSFWANLKGER